MLSKISLASSALIAATMAADTDAWKERIIYQVLTDRFAQNQGENDGCGDLSNYCGGTWSGIANNLDYI
jgi:alpha-amylase